MVIGGKRTTFKGTLSPPPPTRSRVEKHDRSGSGIRERDGRAGSLGIFHHLDLARRAEAGEEGFNKEMEGDDMEGH